MPNGIQHASIGHGGALSPEALRGVQMTPRHVEKNGIKAGTLDNILDKLASLPPADDDEAELPPPPLLALTAEDVERVRELSDDLDAALKLQRLADQRSAACRALAQKVAFLMGRSGTLAAKAWDGTEADKAALTRHNAELQEAQAAAQASPGLAAEAEEAKRQVDAAYGRLRVHTSKAIDRLRRRAAEDYHRSIARAARDLSAIHASLELQGRSYAALASGFYVTLSLVRCPAMPADLMPDRRGIESHVSGGGDMLLTGQHGALTLQSSGFRSKITTQLDAAMSGCGLRTANVVL